MPDAGAKTLVVGTGYTGHRVLAALGEDVVGLSRSGGGLSQAFNLDGDDLLPVEPASGYSVLYSVPPAVGPAEASDGRLQRLLSLLPHPPSRFVYLSTSAVYGDRDGAVVSEDDAPAATTDRAQRRLACEDLLRHWIRGKQTALLILRVPGIYGPNRLGLGRIRQGLAMIKEEEANPGNRIHVDDLAACCVAALEPDRPAGIYNVGDGDTRSSTWFTLEVARQAGLDQPPTVSRDEAEKTFPDARLSFLRESRILNLDRMREHLRPDLKYPDAADGISAALAVNQG